MATLNEQIQEMLVLDKNGKRAKVLKALKDPEDNLTKLLDYLGALESTLPEWPVVVLYSDGSGRILNNSDLVGYEGTIENFETPLDLFKKE